MTDPVERKGTSCSSPSRLRQASYFVAVLVCRARPGSLQTSRVQDRRYFAWHLAFDFQLTAGGIASGVCRAMVTISEHHRHSLQVVADDPLHHSAGRFLGDILVASTVGTYRRIERRLMLFQREFHSGGINLQNFLGTLFTIVRRVPCWTKVWAGRLYLAYRSPQGAFGPKIFPQERAANQPMLIRGIARQRLSCAALL